MVQNRVGSMQDVFVVQLRDGVYNKQTPYRFHDRPAELDQGFECFECYYCMAVRAIEKGRQRYMRSMNSLCFVYW